MITIGLSHAPQEGKYKYYYSWLERAAKEEGVAITIINLGEHPQKFSECDGLILTGGDDVDPAHYGKPEEKPLATSIDEKRDGLEFHLIDEAKKRDVPIVGVCRGIQVLNTALGGTLYTDLQTAGEADHKKISSEEDRKHGVKVDNSSLLKKLAGASMGEVNSSHHQAVDTPAPELRVAARSEDGVIEALEWAEPAGKPFLLAVQWHPERMDFDSPFAGRLARVALREMEAYHVLMTRK